MLITYLNACMLVCLNNFIWNWSKNIKKVIDECYCKHVSTKDNKDLYDEISNLLGMYVYIKDKLNIKPYIIIGNNLYINLEIIFRILSKN